MRPVALENWTRITRWLFVVILLVTAPDALGAEASNNWRPTYDLVMRWLNFGILVVLFFKYARKPLAAFLNGQSKQIEDNIQGVETEKETIKTRVSELHKEREDRRENLNQIRDRVVSQGKLKKQSLIDDAKRESHLLLENAKHKIEHEITSAREKLQAELVDRSINLAIQKLPQLMTDQDAQHSLKMYLEGIQSLNGE